MKRAAARKLDGHFRIGVHFQQIEARYGRQCDIGFFSRPESTGWLTLANCFDEERQGDFPFIQDQVVSTCRLNFFRQCGCIGAAHGHFLAPALSLAHLLKQILLLHDHA
ncbi:hypothetical protein SYNGFB01_01060 [Synechococcus sp. GFB01]|nr:hypothetical protein SYNGFB01_01060 [Synechococcus sp. GFB01]